MHYRTARQQIRSGDVLLFKGAGFWPRLIRWRTGSEFTHAALAVRCFGRLALFEAHERRGVRLFPLSRYLQAGRRIHWFALDDRQVTSRAKIVAHCLAHWGNRYASLRQFLRSWGWLSRWIAGRRRLPADADPTRDFCSELVMAALIAAGLKAAQGAGLPPPARTTPGDLAALSCLTDRGPLQWRPPSCPPPSALRPPQ